MRYTHVHTFQGQAHGRRAAPKHDASDGTQRRTRQSLAVLATADAQEVALEPTKLQPVDKVLSARVEFTVEGEPYIEYLARWKEDGGMTWEPSENLSEDLIRDFEEVFWQACKTADMAVLEPALKWGGETIANIVNEDRRSALHFAAALNHKNLVTRLLEAGAYVDVQDRDGYTPLHMAAGYLHVDACNELLAGGADPSRADRQGRDINNLIDNLREKMSSANAINQRMRLEEVNRALTYFVYEDVAPAAVLDKRKTDGQVQYLVKWRDGSDDSWVPEAMISEEVRQDYEAGLEYAEAISVSAVRGRGMAKEYLVKWADGTEDTWESEDHVSKKLVTDFERQRRQGTSASDKASEKPATSSGQADSAKQAVAA